MDFEYIGYPSNLHYKDIVCTHARPYRPSEDDIFILLESVGDGSEVTCQKPFWRFPVMSPVKVRLPCQ